MTGVNIGHCYAEWMPSGSPDKPGREPRAWLAVRGLFVYLRI